MTTKAGKLGVRVLERAKELGELCNNPLNIMGAKDNWQGKAGMHSNSAGGYVVFKELNDIPGWVYGFRAAFVDWNSKLKVDKDGKLTVPELIAQWAPSNVHDNDTDGYISRVLKEARMKSTDGINLKDREQCIRVAKAMCIVENRRCIYSDEDIGWGWDLAHGVKARKSPLKDPKVLATGAAFAAGATDKALDSSFVEKATDVVTDHIPSLENAAYTDGWLQYVLLSAAGVAILFALYTLYKDTKGEK